LAGDSAFLDTLFLPVWGFTDSFITEEGGVLPLSAAGWIGYASFLVLPLVGVLRVSNLKALYDLATSATDFWVTFFSSTTTTSAT
jgi:hypothetical protein